MTQKESYIIEDREVLKEIVDITRQKIVRALYDDPLTAEDIANKVDFPQEKIYYHLKKLESAGIIQSENAGIVNGINQKQYLNVAKNIIVKMDMLKPGSDQEDRKFIHNVLSQDHIKVMSLVDQITGYNEEPVKPVMRSKTFNVPEKKYQEIAAQLKQIYDQLESAQAGDKKSDSVSVHLDMKFFIFKKSSK
ncbi:MAG: winged helix-turn-helix domain-containing protein [Candidatus Marinimicrobia bacterium]|nr:winged helix-turn-helix domain-containing protein [Candidatus Neomarinimicrobiota bacterium]